MQTFGLIRWESNGLTRRSGRSRCLHSAASDV